MKAFSITAKWINAGTITQTYNKKERQLVSMSYALDKLDRDKMCRLC